MAERTCSIEGCSGPTGGPGTAKGYCESHYRRNRIYGDPLASRVRPRTFCSIEGCSGPCVGRGWCEKHYNRWKRNGDPNDPGRRASIRPSGLRRCGVCRVEKPLDEFYDTTTKLKYRCKVCARAAARLSVGASVHRRRARMRSGAVEIFDNAEIFERDGWRCGICGKAIGRRRSWPDPLSVSLDHIVPIARGGDHTRANTQAAHLRCNLRKHCGGVDQLKLIG